MWSINNRANRGITHAKKLSSLKKLRGPTQAKHELEKRITFYRDHTASLNYLELGDLMSLLLALFQCGHLFVSFGLTYFHKAAFSILDMLCDEGLKTSQNPSCQYYAMDTQLLDVLGPPVESYDRTQVLSGYVSGRSLGPWVPIAMVGFVLCGSLVHYLIKQFNLPQAVYSVSFLKRQWGKLLDTLICDPRTGKMQRSEILSLAINLMWLFYFLSNFKDKSLGSFNSSVDNALMCPFSENDDSVALKGCATIGYEMKAMQAISWDSEIKTWGLIVPFGLLAVTALDKFGTLITIACEAFKKIFTKENSDAQEKDPLMDHRKTTINSMLNLEEEAKEIDAQNPEEDSYDIEAAQAIPKSFTCVR